jgi:DNA repair exonuclease SbcCD ATPase subunit
MTKIIQLTAENVKRLQAVDITPQGNVVEISGANGQGKSSVLDAIAMALGGANEAPTMPIRRGAEKAKIVLQLDNLKVIRTFTKSGSTLIVETADGARFQSPQAILDKLTGKITFDPLAFIRLKRDEQAKVLRDLVGLDFTAQDYERRQLYDARTVLNAAVKKAQAVAEAMPFHKDAPEAEPDTAALLTEIEEANRRNKAFDDEESQIARMADQAVEWRNTAASWREEIVRLEAALVEARAAEKNATDEAQNTIAALEDLKLAHASTDKVDEAPIRQRIKDAELVRSQVRQNWERAAALKAVEDQKAGAFDLTLKIDALDKAKNDALAATKFPLEGLSFSETGVVFDGIPFDQVNTAEQLRVSVAIAAAMNPKLKVMLIRHGNDLDAESFAQLGVLAAEHGLQVWIERIEGGKGAVVIEDGTVRVEG